MKKRMSANSIAMVLGVAIVLLALLLGMTFTGMSAYAAENKTRETKVAHLTDIHIMPLEYANVYSKKFIKDMGTSKLLEETEGALSTALGEIYEMEDAPMYIVVSGDLTSNGEKQAHIVVAKYFKELTQKMRARAGYEKFQIFVMPGNHDMYNDRAVSYLPTEAELAACATEDDMRELLTEYGTRSVATATSKDIFEIYSDFGYCNCDGRKEGVHDETCGMADGIKLSFFYESSYWYDKETKRVNTASGVEYKGFEVKVPTKSAVSAYENDNKNFEYIAEDGRMGLCSYIATTSDGMTIVGLDGSARKYTGANNEKGATVAEKTAGGWNETTGGFAPRAALRWILDVTKDPVADGNLVMVDTHFNNIPHFVSQDEVISLFVLDNLEEYNATLAQAGIRYTFSGHQHASDITNTVTQDGSVLYDFETASTISYGSAFRIVDFNQVWKNGDYYEEVKSTVHSLDKNGDGTGFYYGAYVLTCDAAEEDILTEDASKPEIFSARHPNLYDGTDYLTLVKKSIKDDDGQNIGIGDYLAIGLGKMISFDGIVGNYVNDGLYDMLAGMTSGISNSFPFLGGLVNSLINGLANVDLPALKIAPDKKSFTITANAVKGNDLVKVATDLVTYLLEYDFSYGDIPGGVRLNEIMVLVYGGHLSGAHGDEVHERVAPLIKRLNDGTFVDFLVDTLVGSVVSELDYLLNVPIRFNPNTPALSEGKGLDICDAMNKKSSGLIDTAIKNLIRNNLFNTVDAKGYTSLKNIINDISEVAVDLLVTDVDEIPDDTISMLADIVRPLLANFGNIGKYVDMAIAYIKEYLDVGNITTVLNDELIDKYVTDAFCRNLGNYAAYILTGMSADDTPDGSSWTTGDYMKQYCVKDEVNFNVTTSKHNASTAYKGKAYYRASGSNGKLDVEPTIANGLLPSMVTVSYNGDVATGKKIGWFTSIDVNVTDKNAKGEYEFSVPDSYIQYSLNKDMSAATTKKATGENVDKALPTIDLGIAIFNLSHRNKTFNRYSVSLSGLEAGKTYYYRLGSDKYGWSEVFSFTTASSGAFTFMAITDVQGSVENNYVTCLPDLKKAIGHFDGEEIAFIASMGDNVDNGKNLKQFGWWLDGQNEVWSNNTLVTSGGNHEKSEYALSNIIALPDEANVAATGHYYSYDYNYAHFIVLDTNDIQDNMLADEQVEWLLEDLEKDAKNKATKWTIVMLHKGPYTAGSHAFDADVIGLRAQLTPIFAENGVDLVLQGHDHTYSVSEYIGKDGRAARAVKGSNGAVATEGVLYINLGTMGDKYYDYIYSDEVTLVKRDSVDDRIAKYLTADGNLELTETPVFADITVEEGLLKIKTYTIVNGEIVPVDDIVLSNGSMDSAVDKISAIICIVIAGVLIIGLIVVMIITGKKKKEVIQ